MRMRINHSSPCLERCNVARDGDFDDVRQMKMEMVVITIAVVVMSPMLLKMMVMTKLQQRKRQEV